VLAYRDPQIFHSRWQWTAELIGERSTKTIDQFSVLRGSVGNGLATDLLPRLKGGAELQVERADTFNVKPQSFLEEDQGISWTVALSPFLVFDGRNDPFAPTSGVFDSLRLRYAPPGLSTVQLGKINMQHSQAFPLARWLSFVYNARVGFGRAFSGGPGDPRTLLPRLQHDSARILGEQPRPGRFHSGAQRHRWRPGDGAELRIACADHLPAQRRRL
jgi:outer membrane protein assembly factor BamA